MGNGIADREVGQGIACPGDQLCKILGMRQAGVFNEGWCLEGKEGSGRGVMRLGADPAGPLVLGPHPVYCVVMGSHWRLLGRGGVEAGLGFERGRKRPSGGLCSGVLRHRGQGPH